MVCGWQFFMLDWDGSRQGAGGSRRPSKGAREWCGTLNSSAVEQSMGVVLAVTWLWLTEYAYLCVLWCTAARCKANLPVGLRRGRDCGDGR